MWMKRTNPARSDQRNSKTIGRCSFMTPPGGNFQRRTVFTASSLSKGHGDGCFANAETTRPSVSIVNSTSTVPV